MAKQAARNAAGDGSDSDSENEDLPFACLICREPFGKEPVVTLCGHYFDSKCAIKRYGKTAKCFACGKPTNGVFNKYVIWPFFFCVLVLISKNLHTHNKQ